MIGIEGWCWLSSVPGEREDGRAGGADEDREKRGVEEDG